MIFTPHQILGDDVTKKNKIARTLMRDRKGAYKV